MSIEAKITSQPITATVTGTGVAVTASGGIGPAGPQGPTGATGPAGPSYMLPAATSSVLGGVKAGSNVSVAGDGTISVPLATTSAAGAVVVGSGLSVSSGTLSASVTSVASRTGAVTLTASDVGLSSVSNTSDSAKPVSTAQAAADSAVQAYAVQRANHTGTQAVGTITGLATVATSGAYADLIGKPTIPAAYSLPVATSSVLGGVKAGANVTIAGDGTVSVAGPVTTLSASAITGLAALATSASASDLSSGTVPTARLATGTANSTTYLRGDGTWAAVSGGSSGISQADADVRYVNSAGDTAITGALTSTQAISCSKISTTGGRSLFTAGAAGDDARFGIGVRQVSGGYVYFGASDDTLTPGMQISRAGGGPMLTCTEAGAVSIPGSLSVAGSAVVVTSDARLSDARAPLAHTQAASTITDFATEAAKYGPVASVSGRTGTVVLAKADVGLGSVDNTADASKPVSTAQAAADAAVQAYAIQRANHTGSQLSSTISDFAAQAALYGPVSSVAARTGAVVLTSTDVGLGSVNNTADSAKPVSTAQAAADAAVQAYAVQRANHTGTQAAGTITGLATVATSGSAADLGSGTLPVARLPLATSSVAGAVIVGSGLSVSSGTVSAAVTSVAGRTGAVTLSSSDVSGVVPSLTSGITGAASITNMVSLTAAQYAALGTKSSTTLYIVTG